MPKLKWSGLNHGYVSNDGRFLVAPCWVEGKRGKVQKWAVYGLVIERSPTGDARVPPWSWGERWLKGPFERKRDAQDWCEASKYETPVRSVTTPTEPTGPRQDKPGPGRCPECTVRFEAHPGHQFEEWCGKNCAEEALERLKRILDRGTALHDIDGKPLRIGPARANEPDFRPTPRRTE
jgi:hypothetical protein